MLKWYLKWLCKYIFILVFKALATGAWARFSVWGPRIFAIESFPRNDIPSHIPNIKWFFNDIRNICTLGLYSWRLIGAILLHFHIRKTSRNYMLAYKQRDCRYALWISLFLIWNPYVRRNLFLLLNIGIVLSSEQLLQEACTLLILSLFVITILHLHL